jgi:hypothetical protein
MSPRPAHTLTVTVGRDTATTAAFVRDGHNLPVWAPGFARAARPDGDGWVVSTGTGEVRVEFVPDNPWGVVDHRVTGPGLDLLVPMRVVPAGDGCAVVLTIIEDPDADPTDVERDIALVHADLEQLRSVLEAPPPPAAAG